MIRPETVRPHDELESARMGYSHRGLDTHRARCPHASSEPGRRELYLLPVDPKARGGVLRREKHGYEDAQES